MMIEVQVRPARPFAFAQLAEHEMWTRGHRGKILRKPIRRSLEACDVPIEILGSRAALFLIRLGTRFDPLGPPQGSIQRDPFEQARANPAARRYASGGPFAEQVAKRVRAVTDHLRRCHPSPAPWRVRAQSSEALEQLISVVEEIGACHSS